MRCFLLLFAGLAASGACLAQQAQVRTSSGPYYVGVPIDIEIIADGFNSEPQPQVNVGPPVGATLELVSVNPNISTSIQIINGRMNRRETVRFVYRYRLIARQAGYTEVGPFELTQGNTSAKVNPIGLQISAVPTASDQRFRLIVPDGPLWVGQRVPITLEWWLPQAAAERITGRRAQVPLFNQVDRFVFEDQTGPRARNRLIVDTTNGTLELPAEVRETRWRDQAYLVVSAQRTLIALRDGEISVEPASMVVEQATRWSRDLFGNRVAAAVQRLRVEDQVRTLTFQSPPEQGRPTSFNGAVGQGFTISVSADRTVVQAGDPISLTITMRGDGALAAAALPPLEASLDSADFNIPGGTNAGILEDGVKRFEVSLRVKHDRVREIPPIALAWFNPALGQYETTQSRPIALSVREATIVSAADVVSAHDEAVDPPSAAVTTEASSSTPTFTLGGAELAIETDMTRLLAEANPWYSRSGTILSLYTIALALIALALALRRRAAIDPVLRERQRQLNRQRQILAGANDAAELAAALRRMAALSPHYPRQQYDTLLLACDNLAYAPQKGQQAAVDPNLRRQALDLADTMLREQP